MLQQLKKPFKKENALINILFFTEACQLFGRFSLSSTLVLYLTHVLRVSDAYAFSVFTTSIALFYITPLIGGYFSDRLLGDIKATAIGASLMAIGSVFLFITNLKMIILGLSIMAVGGGFFLPSITALFGSLQDNRKSRDSIFTLYYLAKNVGALAGPLACGYISLHFGYQYAFLMSAIVMLSGAGVFIAGSSLFVKPKTKTLLSEQKPPVKKSKKSTKLLLLLYPLVMIPFINMVIEKQLATYVIIATIGLAALYLTLYAIKASKTDRNHIIIISILMLFYIVFEGILSQGGTTLNLFIDRIINRNFFGHLIPTQGFFALDPLFMFIIGPVLVYIFSRLNKKNKEPFVTTKFIIALTTLALGFSIFILAATVAKTGIKPSLFHVVIAYFIFPLSELIIIPTGLSLVTKLAPENMKTLMVGVWMLSTSVSSYVTGLVSKLGDVDFKINSPQTIQKAAPIYHYNFMVSVMILLGSALVIFMISGYMKKLIKS